MSTNQPTDPPEPNQPSSSSQPGAGQLDPWEAIAGLQQQVDDLTRAVAHHQQVLEELLPQRPDSRPDRPRGRSNRSEG